MSRQIWRFPIDVKRDVKVTMPKGATVLCVQTKDEQPCMWAEVDTNADKETRFFEIFGTGHDMPVDMGVQRKYIGTFQLGSVMGTLMFHVYERLN